MLLKCRIYSVLIHSVVILSMVMIHWLGGRRRKIAEITSQEQVILRKNILYSIPCHVKEAKKAARTPRCLATRTDEPHERSPMDAQQDAVQ